MIDIYAVIDLNRIIEETDQRIEALYTRLLPGAIRYDKDKVQSTSSDQMTNIGVALADLLKRRENFVRLKHEAQIELQDAFFRYFQKPEIRSLLILYFIKDMSVNEISEITGKSYSKIYYTIRRNTRIFNDFSKSS